MFILVNGGSLRIKLKQVAITYVLMNKKPAPAMVLVLLLFHIAYVKVPINKSPAPTMVLVLLLFQIVHQLLLNPAT